jgi:hypothetical protein
MKHPVFYRYLFIDIFRPVWSDSNYNCILISKVVGLLAPARW